MAIVTSPDRSRSGPVQGLGHWLAQKIGCKPLAMPPMEAARLRIGLEKGVFDPAMIYGGPGASKFIGKADSNNRMRVTDDGIALVSVAGLLIDRGEFLGDMYGLFTTYEGLSEQFRRLAKDDTIKSVVLDIDSGGGMVAGLFDVCADIGTLKKKKKVYAIAANMAASAAYAIGSTAHEIYATRSACLGSIGIIQYHQSYAEMLAAAGVETTIIQSGSHKSDGNPFQALSHSARAQMSAESDQAYQMFVSLVAKNRPLEEEAVRATEARCYYGSMAVDAKLADGVKSIDDLLAHIRQGKPTKSSPTRSGRGSNASTGGRMSTDNNGTENRPDYDAVIAASLASIAAARPAPQPAAVAPAPQSAASSPAPVDAAATERARIAAIVDSPEGKANAALAAHFAFKTGMSADDAIAALKAAGPAVAATATAPMADALAQQMRNPANAGGVKPEAPGADPKSAANLPPLGDVFAARFPNPRNSKKRA